MSTTPTIDHLDTPALCRVLHLYTAAGWPPYKVARDQGLTTDEVKAILEFYGGADEPEVLKASLAELRASMHRPSGDEADGDDAADDGGSADGDSADVEPDAADDDEGDSTVGTMTVEIRPELEEFQRERVAALQAAHAVLKKDRGLFGGGGGVENHFALLDVATWVYIGDLPEDVPDVVTPSQIAYDVEVLARAAAGLVEAGFSMAEAKVFTDDLLVKLQELS